MFNPHRDHKGRGIVPAYNVRTSKSFDEAFRILYDSLSYLALEPTVDRSAMRIIDHALDHLVQVEVEVNRDGSKETSREKKVTIADRILARHGIVV